MSIHDPFPALPTSANPRPDVPVNELIVPSQPEKEIDPVPEFAANGFA